MRFCAVLLLLAATASAQPAPDLTKEFQAGIDAFRLGHYDEARGHLEKARELDPKLPGPHRFLAALAQAQGRWKDCLDEARIALVLNPRSSEAVETRKLHADCRAGAGKEAYHGTDLVDGAAVAVTTNVPGATVKIAGLVYGGTPLSPRPIAAGTLDVELEKPGWKSVKVSIDAPPGIVTDVDVDLEPDPTSQANPELQNKPVELMKIGWIEAPGDVLVDGKSGHGEVQVTPGTHTVELRAPDKDLWRRRVHISAGQKVTLRPEFVDTASREHNEHIGFALLGGGGALLAAGFATAVIADHASADAREYIRVETARDPSNPGYNIEPKHTRADVNAAVDRANQFSLISEVSFGAALVTMGIGAYYLYKGEAERADVPPPFAISPTHDGGFVSKEIRW
jgi:hypothetical protein